MMLASEVAVTLILVLVATFCSALDYSFTFRLAAGEDDCFYEHVKGDSTFELEYQVVEGGELDINFRFVGPNYEIIESEERKMDGLHSIHIANEGDYAMCFDNTFSHISHKLVFVDVIIDTKDENAIIDDNNDQELKMTTLAPDTIVLDMKVQDLRLLLHNVTNHLDKVEIYQQFFRAREARHRYTLESNKTRVFWWSLLYCIIIIVVAIVQVFVLRSLFRNRRQDKITT